MRIQYDSSIPADEKALLDEIAHTTIADNWKASKG